MRTKKIPFTGEAKGMSEAMRREYGGGARSYAAGNEYAAGGRVYPRMNAGAGSGEGRLEKGAKYGKKGR